MTSTVREMTKYEEYAMLDSQIKALSLQKEELRTNILEILKLNNEKSMDTPVGKFGVTLLKTWTYTGKVSELEGAFKAQKAMEQSTGDATYEEKPSLKFTSVKF